MKRHVSRKGSLIGLAALVLGLTTPILAQQRQGGGGGGGGGSGFGGSSIWKVAFIDTFAAFFTAWLSTNIRTRSN